MEPLQEIITLKTALSLKLPNLDGFGEGVLENVFTQKLCHTRIQGFVSAKKNS